MEFFSIQHLLHFNLLLFFTTAEWREIDIIFNSVTEKKLESLKIYSQLLYLTWMRSTRAVKWVFLCREKENNFYDLSEWNFLCFYFIFLNLFYFVLYGRSFSEIKLEANASKSQLTKFDGNRENFLLTKALHQCNECVCACVGRMIRENWEALSRLHWNLLIIFLFSLFHSLYEVESYETIIDDFRFLIPLPLHSHSRHCVISRMPWSIFCIIVI